MLSEWETNPVPVEFVGLSCCHVGFYRRPNFRRWDARDRNPFSMLRSPTGYLHSTIPPYGKAKEVPQQFAVDTRNPFPTPSQLGVGKGFVVSIPLSISSL